MIKAIYTPNDIDLKQFRIPETDTIVFINGHYSTTLSDKINGVQLLTGIEYFEYKNSENNLISKCPFELLNTAFMDSGMNIIIKKSNTQSTYSFSFYYFIFRKYNDFPKINIDCENNSSFTFLEHTVSDSNNFFLNSSISCSLGENSSMRHIKIIGESKNGVIFNKINVHQKNNSRYDFLQFCYDSNFSRTNIETELYGEGAVCRLSGLSISRKNQQLGAHIVTNHFAPHCMSSQNFKNILLDNSSGIFNGRTIVHKNAQKTDSQQSNKT